MSVTSRSRTLAVALTTGALVAGLTAATAGPASAGTTPERPDFTLTVVHANDQESALLPIEREGAEYAGAALFTAQLELQRQQALRGGPRGGGKRGVITLGGGDNFLPSAQLDASRQEGAPIYDALAFNAARYDVSALGNHDFDLTPDFLAEFLAQVRPQTTFVAANLDFSGEPVLQAYVDDGTIVDAHVVRERGERIGVIGLTTPDLPELTSSRNVVVDPALAEIANAQAALLADRGVDKVIVVSHLQDIDNEIALVAQLEGVDVVVGAGGGEVMADADHALIPGDMVSVDAAGAPLEYPTVRTAADGAQVPIVTTSGLYRYVGKLVVQFDDDGDVTGYDEEASRPVPAASVGPDAVRPDRRVQATVEQPVADFVQELRETVIATSEVSLDGVRGSIRSVETNLGNLVTDSLLWAGQREAATAGVTAPQVAIQNGGGIRNDSVVPPGDLTLFDTFSIVPFPNFVSVAPELPIEDFVAAVEHGSVQGAGSFAQIAGFSYTVDLAAAEGSRLRSLTLDDGTPVVVDGALVATGTISLASIDFLLRGQDGYDALAGTPFTLFTTTQQEAFADYLTEELGGVVTSADYPVGGEGRIQPV